MQHGKHTRLILEMMRLCHFTAGEHLHTLENTFFSIFKKFRKEKIKF